MLLVGDDHLAVGELDLKARPPAHDLGRGDHPRRLAVRAQQQVPWAHQSHRRPPERGWQRRVQRQRLADGGPGRDDDHLPGVQAVGERVQVGEPGGHAGDAAAVRADRLDLLERARHDLRQRVIVLGEPPVGDGEHLGLRPVHELVGLAVAGVAELHDPGAGLHQPPQDRALPHDPRVVAGVGRGRHGRDQRVQVRRAADAAELTAPAQLVGDRDRVCWLAARIQVEDRLVHELVRGPVVVDGPDDLDHVRDRVLGQQHPAKHALFGGDVVRRHALEFFAPLRHLGHAHRTPPPPDLTRLVPVIDTIIRGTLTFWRQARGAASRSCG